MIKSRKEADRRLNLIPNLQDSVVPANMASVINEELAVWLAQNDYYYVMHRFFTRTGPASLSECTTGAVCLKISVGIRTASMTLSINYKRRTIGAEAHHDRRVTWTF